MILKHCIRLAAACLLLSSCSHKDQNQNNAQYPNGQNPQTTGANVGSETNPPSQNMPQPSQGTTPEQGNMPEQGNATQGNTNPQGNMTTPEQGGTTHEGATGNTTPGNGTGGTTDTQNGTQGSGTTGGGNDMGAGAMNASTLNDAQIAEIVTESINDGLMQSRFAATHATDARVKRFAQRMVGAAGDESSKLTMALQKASITPVASPISGQLNAQSHEKLDALKAHSGSDFDHAYIDNIVSSERDRIDMIDNKLLPNVKSPELKASLASLRTKTENHLHMAEDLQKSFNK